MTDVTVIKVDIFNIDVRVFYDDESRIATLKSEGCCVEEWNPGAIASTHIDITETGQPRFSFVIKSHATVATCAHECSHMADFICDTLGIPISLEATEIRAYLVGHLMTGLMEKVGFLLEDR